MSFIHLHNHSDYSLLDGALKIDDLIKRAVEFKMPAVALTDHGNIFGAIEFYRKAVKQGIKPILGIETYLSADDSLPKEGGKPLLFHLVLLVKNYAGYRNLIKLSSKAFLEGFYYKPRITRQWLKEYHEGLICLSACAHGEIAHHFIQDNPAAAKEAALFYQEIFGDDFYLEVQNHGLDSEDKARPSIFKLGEELGIKTVATNDCHYALREHVQSHDILLCIQTGKNLNDTDRLKYDTDQLYFKSPEEMRTAFPDNPEILENTLEIAGRCNLSLNFNERHLPHFPLPEDADAADVSEYLELCAKEGAVNRFGEKPDERTARRLEEELSIIKQMGFPGYFLIVKDFTDFARSQKIAVGPGRGSAAGSLVSYCLGITNIDPMEYGLLFERFLNPERVSMPDIDIDFADDRRGEVISYVRDKYGHDNVTQIITFGKMLARQVVRDVGRVMGFPYAEVDRIAKKIPFMPGMTLEKAMREALDLKELIEANPPYQELMKHCLVLEGLNRNSGTHAAGVVITPGSITDYIPLAKSSEGDTTSQWDMRVLEKMGLLKMDFLGLKTLTVIENTLRLIRERGGNLAIYSIPMNDKKSYELFHQGRTVGVFQFESSGMTEYLKKLKPERLDDLIAMNALYRPGPMQFIDDFIRRKHGKEKIKYIHPKLESILRGTYGVIVYQEQVIQIAHEIAGFSMGKADILRRAMGKKKKDVMESMKQEFIEGVTANGIDNKTGQEIFDLIERFAQYGFNKSHSAGYALVAYQTAYLKAHYPSEFMAATMTSEMSRDSSRFMTLVNECNKIGVEVLPPDVNESEYDFTVSDSRIRFGLGAVKNVGAGPVESIMEAGKRVGRLSDIFEFIQEVDQRLVNRKVLESLIQAGAFDSIDPNRARLFESIDSIISYGNAAHSEKERGQFTFLDSEGGAGRVFMRPQLNSGAIWSDSEKLNREQSVLGYYISGNPLDEFRIEVENFASPPIEGLEGMADGSKVRLCGIMSKVKRQLTKNGDMMAIVSLLDFTGEVETRCFQKGLEQSWNLIGEDAKVVIKGRVSTREDEPVKVLADEIIPLQESLSVFSESLLIRIDLQDFDQGRLNKLETLFRGNSGSFDVNIILSCNGDTVNLKSSRYRVNINKSLLKDLNLLLGDGKVKLGVK